MRLQLLFTLSHFTQRATRRAVSEAAAALAIPPATLNMSISNMGRRQFARLMLQTAVILKPSIILLTQSLLDEVGGPGLLLLETALKDGLTLVVSCQHGQRCKLNGAKEVLISQGRLITNRVQRPEPNAHMLRFEGAELRKNADLVTLATAYRSTASTDVVALSVTLTLGQGAIVENSTRLAESLRGNEVIEVLISLAPQSLKAALYLLHLRMKMSSNSQPFEMSQSFSLTVADRGGITEFTPISDVQCVPLTSGTLDLRVEARVHQEI
ncbi:MAG TPA: hypothetical protein VGU45_17475 [Microvirga sp.]|jgi:hypothetical protein|nr:hypothetical protein [Microvirga sp.]